MKLNRVVVVVRLMPKSMPGCKNLRFGGQRPINIRGEHAAPLRRILSDLDGLGIAWRVVGRDALKGEVRADLIVSVGGDGTFLASSHHAGDVPIIGVNPDPKTSVGFFCIAKTAGFRAMLAGIIAGKIRPVHLPLIETHVGSEKLPILALNDVLFAGRSPAETVRYHLTVNGRPEDQKSSGVWIAAGPGSTAAIGSAGGKKQMIASRRLQYLVREPYRFPNSGHRHLRGILAEGRGVAIKSSMGRGTIYIDGHGHSYAVPWKARVRCRISRKTLKAFV